jgi:hypothetical protein
MRLVKILPSLYSKGVLESKIEDGITIQIVSLCTDKKLFTLNTPKLQQMHITDRPAGIFIPSIMIK